jgi:hypothetical protein
MVPILSPRSNQVPENDPPDRVPVAVQQPGSASLPQVAGLMPGSCPISKKRENALWVDLPYLSPMERSRAWSARSWT